MTEYIKKSDVINLLKYHDHDKLFDNIVSLKGILVDELDCGEGLVKQVVEELEYLCGCRNCIDAVTNIIKKDFKPRTSQCEECSRKDTCDGYKITHKESEE